MRALGIASAILSSCFALSLRGQTATPTAFVTTIGKDTFCLEQYSRSGMKYSTPGSARPDLDSLSVGYGRDTATVRFFGRDSSQTWRIAMREAFPLLGQSYVGVELALMRLRRMHVESSTITLDPPSEPTRPVSIAPIRFVSGDSAVLGAGVRMHVGADGSILGLRAGSTELHRVAPFDMAALTDGFVKAFAPRVAALAAAAAARAEIPLQPSQLERFTGDYSLGQTTFSITRDGEHLMLRVPQQPAIQLMAMSPTEFFARKPDLVVAFESDSTGRVTSLTIGQGETKQRLTRKN